MSVGEVRKGAKRWEEGDLEGWRGGGWEEVRVWMGAAEGRKEGGREVGRLPVGVGRSVEQEGIRIGWCASNISTKGQRETYQQRLTFLIKY